MFCENDVTLYVDQVLELSSRLQAFSDSCIDDGVNGLFAWTELPLRADHLNSEFMLQRKVSCELFQSITYMENQEPNESKRLPGLISCSPQTIALAEDVNLCKAEIKKLYRPISKSKNAVISNFKGLCNEKLRPYGLDRIHNKQITRKLTILDEAPVSAGFSVSEARGFLGSLSINEARTKLIAFGEDAPHIEAQLKMLNNLPYPGDRTSFIIVREKRHQVIMANLKYEDGRREPKKLSMPLLYPAAAASPPPNCRINRSVSIETCPNKRTRSDKRYFSKPALPSLSAYLI